MENERADTAVFDIGRAAHRLVLGVGNEFVEYPASVLASNGATSTDAVKAFAKECRSVGITPLSASAFKLVHEMAKRTNDRLAEIGITLVPDRSELVAIAFIFTEKEGPYDCSVIDLHRDPGSEADWMGNARSGAIDARRLWRECTANGNWPGHPARRAIIGAPNWHVTKWERRGLNRVTAASPDTRAAVHEDQKPTGE